MYVHIFAPNIGVKTNIFFFLCFQLVTDHPCDHCQCRNGKISCYWQVCDGSPDFNCVPLFVPGTCCPVYSCGGTGNDKNIEKNTSEKQSQEKIQKPKTNIKH